MKARAATFGDFRCTHCHTIVPSTHLVSGVNNRNHCPYCLWSCHLDLYAAGDRLSACKAPMKPVGLTIKVGRNKYQEAARGELMLIHQCTECGTLSINRIAADDDAETVLTVFQDSLMPGHQFFAHCQECGIAALKSEDAEIVYTQLYGLQIEIPFVALT
jgi:hypothetical protein